MRRSLCSETILRLGILMGSIYIFGCSRELEPVYDAATFGLAFPHVERPHLIILPKRHSQSLVERIATALRHGVFFRFRLRFRV